MMHTMEEASRPTLFVSFVKTTLLLIINLLRLLSNLTGVVKDMAAQIHDLLRLSQVLEVCR